MKKLANLALFAALLIAISGCSNSQKAATEAAAAEALAKKDAAVQAKADIANAAFYAAKAARAASVKEIPSTVIPRRIAVDTNRCSVPNHEDSEQFGLILNLNSLLCAKVIKVCPLKVDALEVTCVEYRGGSATKTYIVNIKTAVAFEQ